jgi:Ca2+-transporting ATPase
MMGPHEKDSLWQLLRLKWRKKSSTVNMLPPFLKRFDEASFQKSISSLPVLEVYNALETEKKGLSLDEAKKRLKYFGRNTIHKLRKRPLYFDFLSNFTHTMAVLLWVGGFIAFVTQSPELGIAIWMVNFINGSFSFWQEYKAEKAVEALRSLIPIYARVVREGEERRILAEELVPGDIMLLSEGDRISADGRVVEAATLRVDQSSLTGESYPISKGYESAGLDHSHLSYWESPNLLCAGTSVISGHAMAVVLATGMRSEYGKIAHLTQSVEEELSPLQRELQKISATITLIGVCVGFVFFWLSHLFLGMTLAQCFLLALGMIIAFVPEGLLPTMTLSLAIGVQRMAKRNALIKRLSSVEALGRTNVICTDKTGTLTHNEMTVRSLWLGGQQLSVTGLGYATEGQILNKQSPVSASANPHLEQLLLGAVLCNNARLVAPDAESPQWRSLGDPTEAALLVVGMKGGLNLDVAVRLAPRRQELAFDSFRKRMTTVHQFESSLVAYMKGSPEEVLERCTFFHAHGADQSLNDEQRRVILAANDEFARSGLRILAVAVCHLPADLNEYNSSSIEGGMTFLGLIAMHDPPRSDIPDAIEKCHRAGIRVVMMTGDHSLTAEGVARSLGMLRTVPVRILTGSDLDKIDDPTLKAALKEEVLFARITPYHKLRVVTVLQQMGNIVAVTGDGVNDAPALKKAEMGIAMGLKGAEVAKEAADMILTDDCFMSIVNAIEEARTVYDNIRKFITYVFGSNMAEGVPFIVTLFSFGLIPLPITVMQTISLDLGTDMIPAVALGADPPEKGVMDRPPHPPNERLLNRRVIILGLLWHGLIDSIAGMSAYFFLNWEHGWPNHPLASVGTPVYQMATTMTFAAIVSAQAGAVFACQSYRTSILKMGFFTNRLVLWGILFEAGFLLILVYVPFMQGIFNTAPITLTDWVFVLSWAPLFLLADELRKLFIRKFTIF